ncbi:cytochrome c oxidase [Syncephalis fuscata]|nr:cytochrome c oxidase [Syncephalis fuscata]
MLSLSYYLFVLDHHFKQPEIYTGTGAKSGEIPSDADQSTGLERLEILAKIKGQELWDMNPLEVNRLGTVENPIIVETEVESRFVGCTGYPTESHDTLWINVCHDHKNDRCPECGCVFKHAFRHMP